MRDIDKAVSKFFVTDPLIGYKWPIVPIIADISAKKGGVNKIDPTYLSLHKNWSFTHFNELLKIFVYWIIGQLDLLVGIPVLRTKQLQISFFEVAII